jgi:hypothetical protein
MRLILAAAVLAAIASPALAQSVDVRIGEALADKADEYGARDIERLINRLDSQAEAALGRSGRYAGARMELVIEDAAPNRPTVEQLADRPGLSMESLGVGGAEISGEIILADGARIPVAYRWFETSIAHVGAAATWSDAERAFRRFAQRLGEGSY